LDGSDIVLGKFVAAALTALYGLVGFVPGLALALLYGGISGGAVTRMALSLFNAVFLALAAGLWVSTRMRSSQRAFRNAILFLALLFILPWLSPYRSFSLSSDMAYAGARSKFWLSLGATHFEAWLLLGLAGAFLERTWRLPARLEVPPKPLLARIIPPHATRLEVVPMLDKAPIGWIASRLPAQNGMIWGGIFLMLASVALGSLFMPFGLGTWAGLNLMLSLGSGAVFAWLAGRFFFEARRNGELELLLSTPLGARDIVEGCWWAVWRRLRSPLLLAAFLMFFGFLFLLTSRVPVGRGSVSLHFVTTPIIRVLDVITLSWVGMWFGLQARNPSSVVVWTVGLVIGLPWLIGYLIITTLQVTSGGPALSLNTLFGNPLWWLTGPPFHLAKDVFFIRWAAGKLRGELRTVVPLAV
jgi:hypothetical protein